MSAVLCNAKSPLPMRQEFLMFKVEKMILYLAKLTKLFKQPKQMIKTKVL